jgi:hypothetical protein
VIRRCHTALVLLLLALPLRGETCHEWENSVPDQAPVSFKEWLAPTCATNQINNEDYSSFEAPIGHLFGRLDFSSCPASDFPLKVRFIYRRIDPDSVNPKPNGDIDKEPDWTVPLNYVATDAPLGELLEQREILVRDAGAGRSVPLWSIWAPSRQMGDYGNANPYSVFLEVARADGTLLVRRRMVEAVNAYTSRNLGLAKNNSGAWENLHTLADVTTTDELPPEPEVYSDVHLLWLDDETLKDPRYDNNFWQKVFFYGTAVLGHDSEVQQLAQRLGVSPNQRILTGGLWSVDRPGTNLGTLLSTPNANGQYELKLSKDQNPFQTKFDYGRKRTRELRQFSVWFLSSFTVFEIAVIIGSFILLNGYRRVYRWLLIPLSAILYTALGLFAVRFTVDFRPDVFIQREIDSVDGWPQAFVRTDVFRLGFEDGPARFHSSPDAAFATSTVDSNATPLQSVQQDDKTTFSIHQKYGRFATTQISYWVPGASPCQVTPAGQVVATRPLKGAWIWDGKVWRNLGPLTPGQPVVIAQARVVIDPANCGTSGLPANPDNPWQSTEFLPGPISRICSGEYMTTLKGSAAGLLLAVDEQVVPDQMDDAAVSEIRTQTLIVHQFKLPPPQP